jgi:CheY-like chemotaxis protein
MLQTKRPRILLVEDNYATQMLLKIVLGSVGYDLDMVSNGSEGLTFLKGHPDTSLVILDLRMPKHSGVSFLEARARSDELKRVPLMILSGDSTIEEVASNFGIEHYLMKGTKPSALISLVRQLAPSLEAFHC